jgi:hypothetical protein
MFFHDFVSATEIIQRVSIFMQYKSNMMKTEGGEGKRV